MKKSLTVIALIASASAIAGSASSRQIQDYIHFGSNSIDKDDVGAGGGASQAKVAGKPSTGRGFATMDPERQREIARKGGQAAHASGHAHQFTSEEARAAGKIRYAKTTGNDTMNDMTSAADKGVASKHGGGSGGITRGPAAMKAGNSLSPHPASLTYGAATGSIPATA